MGRDDSEKRKGSNLPLFSDLVNYLPSGLNTNVFVHGNHKLSKQVQETQKQYAYLSVALFCSLYVFNIGNSVPDDILITHQNCWFNNNNNDNNKDF